MHIRANYKKKKKKIKAPPFHCRKWLFKNICDEAEITKNPKNPL